MSRQRAFWLFGLTALLCASGCVESDAPAFTVGWDLVYVDINDRGALVSCKDAGTPTVVLTMTNLASQRTYKNTFNCDNQGAESEPLPGGRYSVRIALLNKDGIEVSNSVGEWTLVRDGLTDLGVVTFPIQSFQISWTLARGPMSLGCQDVGAKTVNLITRFKSDPEVVYSFPCEAGTGATTAILLGTYSVRPQLVNAAGTVLWDAESPMTITVNADERAVLPSVVFNL